MTSDPADLHPYTSPEEHLRDVLDLVMLQLKRHIAAHGHRMLQTDGRMSDLYVSFLEAHELMRSARSAEYSGSVAEREGWESVQQLELQLHQHRARMDQRLAQTANQPDPILLPIEELRSAFRLDPVEVELLVAAAAPQLSVDLARLFAFAWADFAVKQPTIGFLAELVQAAAPGLPAASEALQPGARLFARRLLVAQTSGAQAGAGWIHRTIRVPQPIPAALLGHDGALPEALDRLVTIHLVDPARVPQVPLVALDAVTAPLHRALARGMWQAEAHWVVMEGRAGSGRRTLLRQLAAGLGLGVAEVQAHRIAPKDVYGALVDLGRECTIRRLVPLLRLEGIEDEPDRLDEFVAALLRAQAAGVWTATTRGSGASGLRALPRAQFLTIGQLGPEETRAAWESALGQQECRLPAGVMDRLTVKFDLTAGGIHRAVSVAAGTARVHKGGALRAVDLTEADLALSVRGGFDHGLGAMAERLETTLEWADVVLPPEVTGQLDEIVAAVKHRSTVLDEWGFRRKLSYGRGTSCLFSGPPGTGKTMMAGVIARTVGVEIYRIDLSRIASKWVGETEKNLSRLFDEAEKAQVVLLFDEADSLFSRRTSVQSANDRFANMEINFLLQRMESFDGMTILTTNFEESIDEAFKRRIRYHVPFPLPDAPLRSRLWQSMFPARLPLASDVDVTVLGQRFPMAGGNIKNAVMRAAFYAAGAGTAVSQEHLTRAAEAEARTAGLLVRV